MKGWVKTTRRNVILIKHCAGGETVQDILMALSPKMKPWDTGRETTIFRKVW